MTAEKGSGSKLFIPQRCEEVMEDVGGAERRWGVCGGCQDQLCKTAMDTDVTEGINERAGLADCVHCAWRKERNKLVHR